MVKLHVIVEGGTPPINVEAETTNNVEALRESFHQFFRRLLGRDDIDVIVDVGYGNRNAVKMFIAQEGDSYLYVDSDRPANALNEWFEEMANGNPQMPLVIPADRKQDVFFMIQEMEGWFLKQPESLDRWADSEGYLRRHAHSDDKMADHSLIRGKNIEDIKKPSGVVATLVKAFFEKEVGGKKKSARYGKLKTAPTMLDSLDVNSLLSMDSELTRFKSYH